MTVTAKKDTNQPVIKKQKEQEKSFKDSLITYFKGVRSEWFKITWPDRQQILHETLIVIVVTAFVTLVIYLIDLILGGTISTLTKYLAG